MGSPLEETFDHETPGTESGRSRRRFVAGAIKVGSAAGAALWIAPTLTSVALAQENAGSVAPSTTSTTRPEVAPRVEDPKTQVRGAREVRDPAAVDDDGVNVLALTGGDVRNLAVAGGAAVLTGEALLLMRRYFPEPQLALTAGASNPSAPNPSAPNQSAGESPRD